jgi:hypothetical protein
MSTSSPQLLCSTISNNCLPRLPEHNGPDSARNWTAIKGLGIGKLSKNESKPTDCEHKKPSRYQEGFRLH